MKPKARKIFKSVRITTYAAMFASGMYLAYTGYVNVNKNPKYKIKHTEIPNIVNKVQNIKQNIKLKQKSLEDNILSNTYYYEIDSLKQNYKQIIKTEEYKKNFKNTKQKKLKKKNE